MAACRTCKKIKPAAEFPVNRRYASGRDTKCKACCAEATQKHRDKNPSAVSASEARRYAKHKEKREAACKAWREQNNERAREIARAASARWRDKNPDHVREKGRQHAKANPEQYAARAALRRARIAKAVPKWVGPSVKRQLKRIYEEARQRTETTGIPHHVDHIIPIAGDGVRGLHVPWNMRVVTAHENQRKWKHLPKDCL